MNAPSSSETIPMSAHLKPSLDSLPTELIHHIFNYFDTPTCLLSLHKVCKRLYTMIKTYHRYKLDFRLISKSDFHSISYLIPCHHIISLTISDGYKTRGQIQYFFQCFKLEQFTQLLSLSILQINRNDLNELFKSNTIFSLNSLKLQFRENFSLPTETSVSLSSLIEKSNLLKLNFNIWYCPMKNIIWPNECNLESLKIHACSLDGYIKILRQTPRLQTFVLDDLNLPTRNNFIYESSVIETFQHLKSLTLGNCHLYMDQLESVLSFTPSLIHLKIINDTKLLDGYRWERYIQSNLPLLKRFEFFFLYYSYDYLSEADIEILIKPYETSFWLETKQWFVTCEYIRNSMEIRLYSIPICKTNYTYHFDSKKIVYSTSTIMLD